MEDEREGEQEAARFQAQRISELSAKLTTAQAAEAELLRKQRLLEDLERELALNVQKGIASA